MFDLGWQEFMLIALIALIVVGPKDLPRVIRAVSQGIRRVRGFISRRYTSVENTTSSEVKGSPSCQVASSWRWNV